MQVSKKFAYTCVDMESLLTENFHVKLFKRMGFDQPLDFENGDDGPSGGVQVSGEINNNCLCAQYSLYGNGILFGGAV